MKNKLLLWMIGLTALSTLFFVAGHLLDVSDVVLGIQNYDAGLMNGFWSIDAVPVFHMALYTLYALFIISLLLNFYLK